MNRYKQLTLTVCVSAENIPKYPFYKVSSTEQKIRGYGVCCHPQKHLGLTQLLYVGYNASAVFPQVRRINSSPTAISEPPKYSETKIFNLFLFIYFFCLTCKYTISLSDIFNLAKLRFQSIHIPWYNFNKEVAFLNQVAAIAKIFFYEKHFIEYTE